MAAQQVMVRQAVRHDVCMRGAVSIAIESSSEVRFAAAAGAKDGWIEVDIVDFSAGGIGLVSTVFLPRRSLVRVRVMGPMEDQPPLIEASYRIQRNVMTDRRPAYLVGGSFEDESPLARQQVEQMLRLLEGHAA